MNRLPAPAARMQRIQPFHVMALLGRARELERSGRHIVHMEIGEPDFATPEPIVAAGRKALAEGLTHYTPSLGLPALREAIAGFYKQRFAVEVDPACVVVTPGASGALLLVMGLLAEQGRKVLVTDPGYPCNRHFVELMGGQPVALNVQPENGFQPTVQQVEASWDEGTVALMLASPSNPTGTLVDPERMRQLSRLVAARGGVLVVDEIYQGLVYEQAASTSLAIDDQHFVINSFSKFFGMTGWRLGWLVAPPDYVEALDRLAQNVFLAAPTPAQHAALAAFSAETLEILEQRRRIFQQRRDYLFPALRSLGFDITLPPEGAFYLYAGSQRLAADSFELCSRLLEDSGVAVTPGLDFGSYGARSHVRFAYTTDLAELELGVERMRRFLNAGSV